MILAVVSVIFLATSVISAPLLATRQGTLITVYVQKDLNDPTDLQPVTTLASITKEKRQDITVVEVIQNGPNDPNNVTPVTTYIQSGATQTPIPESQPQPEPETVPEQAPTTPATTEPVDDGSDDGSPLSDGKSLLSTINYWRSAYGVGFLTWGTDLEAAAANTGQLDGGSSANEVHHPMDIYTAEVIAPGNDNDNGKDLQGHSPFEVSYLSWLCEQRSDTLGGLCDFQQSIMAT